MSWLTAWLTTASVNDVPGPGWMAARNKSSGLRLMINWWHNINKISHSETASANKAAAYKYFITFTEITQEKEFLHQQVHKCDKTGLFWLKQCQQNFSQKKKKTFSEHKPMNEILSLLLEACTIKKCKIK